MKKLLPVIPLMLFWCGCEKKPTLTHSTATTESAPLFSAVTADEKPFQAFALLNQDPKNYAYPPALIHGLSDAPSKAPSLKWKMAKGRKAEGELNTWLASLNCGESPTPSFLDEKPGKTYQFIAGCFRARFQFPFTTLPEPLSFQSSPYEAHRPTALYLNERLPYFENDFAQFIELPLTEAATQFTVVVPKKDLDLESSIRAFSMANLKTAFQNLKPRRLHLTLPAFQVKPPFLARKALQLTGTESLLGKGTEDLLVYYPIQFDAQGINQKPATENQAATAESKLHFELYKTLVLDRPFFFMILERATRATIAVGKVHAP
jgi:hypothetical protein